MAQGLTRQQLEQMGAKSGGLSAQQLEQAGAKAPQERGFAQNLLKRPLERLVLEPGRRFGEAVGSAITSPFLSEEQKQRRDESISQDKSINVPLLGEFKTKGLKDEDTGKQIAGEALETVSWLIPPAKAGKVIGAGLQGVGRGIGAGAVTGASAGMLGGAGMELQEGGDVGDVAGGVVEGGVMGGLLGGALGGFGASVPAFRRARVEKTEEQANRLAQNITQGKLKDVDATKRAIREIDVDGINSYDDLIRAYNDKVSVLSKKVDDITDQRPSPIKLNLWGTKTKVGNKTVKENPISDAIDHLEEAYRKTNQPAQAERISQLRSKAQREGLTPTEANQLAREYGIEFGQKAFNKVGDPLTSVNAQAFENTRKALKKSIRSVVDDDAFKATDEAMSDFINLRNLSKQVNEKVNKLRGRTTKRGMGEQAGRALFKLVDMITLKGAGGFLRAVVPSNRGLKTMNALDLDKNLNKNIKQLQKILDAKDDKSMLDAINKMMQNIERGSKESFSKGATPSSGIVSKGKDFLKKMNDDQGGFVKNPLAKGDDLVNAPIDDIIGTRVEYLGDIYTIGGSKGVSGDKFSLLNENGIPTQSALKTQVKIAAPAKPKPFPKIKTKDIKTDTLYHGTSADVLPIIKKEGFKFGSELPEDAFRSGGYGAMQDSISFSTDPKQASVFSGQSSRGAVLEVRLKPKAKIVEVDGIEYAEDLNDLIPELKKRNIDGVYIDAEKEVVVFDPKAISLTGKSEVFKPTEGISKDIWNKANK